MANIPLNQAIILGRIELVRNFIQDGAKLEELDANGLTPLMLAVVRNNREICELLIENGADPAAVAHNGKDVLALAVEFGTQALVDFILASLLSGYAIPNDKSPVKKVMAEAQSGPNKKGNIDDELAEIEAELYKEPAAEAASGTAEKVKPLRMKISKAKERALMKEFGLDETVLTEAEMKQRRDRLKALIKLGKTRGYLTNGEISDHLPDKLVDAETLEVVIATLNDLDVAVFEQTPDPETLIFF
jgi:hypothetical protein